MAINWNNYETLKELQILAENNSIDHSDISDCGASVLELVELIARDSNQHLDTNYIANERALSRAFNEMLEETSSDSLRGDEIALNELFNTWSDGLRQAGDIHASQYNDYCRS